MKPGQRMESLPAGGVSDPAFPAQERQLEQQAGDFAAGGRPLLSPARGPQGIPPVAETPVGLGRPLPPMLRRAYEGRLGVDLRRVRLHDDPAAAAQAEELQVEGYAKGDHVVLGRDSAGDSARGELLAHETAHAAQQALPGAAPAVQRQAREGEGIGLTRPAEPVTDIDDAPGAEDGHVLFNRDNADLDAGDRETIDRLVAGNTDPVSVHVNGYASQEGSPEYNRNLSAHRAAAVKRYLEEILPAGSRVSAWAYGETSAFGGRAQNRRVGINVLEETGPLGGSFGSNLTLDPSLPGLAGGTGLPPALPGGLQLQLDPELRSVLPTTRGLPGVDPLPPNFLTAPLYPPAAEFDLGALAPDYAARHLPYPSRDFATYQDHFGLWYGRYVLWGLDPGMAQWLAQKGTEMAARTQLSLEAPTRQESEDRRMGTEPTIIPIDGIMRWLFEQVR